MILPVGGMQSLITAFVVDNSPDKVFLGIGAYRDDQGKPWTLPAVKKVLLMLIPSREGNAIVDHIISMPHRPNKSSL